MPTKIATWAVIIFVGAFLWGANMQRWWSTSEVARDSTDNAAPGPRSGLKIYTDAATGVQYVTSDSGGLCVRVDVTGAPMIDEVTP